MSNRILSTCVRKTLYTTYKQSRTSIRTISADKKKLGVTRFASLLLVKVGELLEAESGYLRGLQPTQEEKEKAEQALSELAYPVTALSVLTGVALPSSTRRVKLEGTKMLALLDLSTMANNIYAKVGRMLYAKPPMTEVLRKISNHFKPNVVEAVVPVVDKEANDKLWDKLYEEVASQMVEFNNQYYGVIYFLTCKLPKPLFDKRLEVIVKEFPLVSQDYDKYIAKMAEEEKALNVVEEKTTEVGV